MTDPLEVQNLLIERIREAGKQAPDDAGIGIPVEPYPDKPEIYFKQSLTSAKGVVLVALREAEEVGGTEAESEYAWGFELFVMHANLNDPAEGGTTSIVKQIMEDLAGVRFNTSDGDILKCQVRGMRFLRRRGDYWNYSITLTLFPRLASRANFRQ